MARVRKTDTKPELVVRVGQIERRLGHWPVAWRRCGALECSHFG
jgi:hypothetical protein